MIAEFIGFRLVSFYGDLMKCNIYEYETGSYEDETYRLYDTNERGDFKFSFDWNWIVHVLKYIKTLSIKDPVLLKLLADISDSITSFEFDIDKTYNLIVKFIQYYNIKNT